MTHPDLTGFTLLPLPPKSKDERTMVLKSGRRVPNPEYTNWRNPFGNGFNASPGPEQPCNACQPADGPAAAGAQKRAGEGA